MKTKWQNSLRQKIVHSLKELCSFPFTQSSHLQSGPLMKLTHIMSNFFLNYIVSEAAKTFGKSHFCSSPVFTINESYQRVTCSSMPACFLGWRAIPDGFAFSGFT